MKILYVTTNYEGVQQHLAEALSSRETDVKVFCFYIRKDMYSYIFKENVAFYNSPYRFRGPFFYKYRLWLAARQCLLVAKKENVTCIHGNKASGEGYICRYVARKLGIPYVLSVRNADLNTGFFWKLPWLKKMIFNNILDAKKVIFLSPAYQKAFTQRLSGSVKADCIQKSMLLPNGIDDFWHDNIYLDRDYAAATQRLREKRIHLIFAGKINRNKNVRLICKSSDILAERNWTVKITIIGKIEDDDVFAEIRDHVEYYEAMPKEQLIEKYRQADIFVMPSFTETFGLVYVEAMTQGLPVVYTRNQGFDQQFPEGTVGFSVDPNNPEELACSIEDICSDYERISQRAVSSVERFQWSSISTQLIETYAEVMNVES